jgi:hypothetical protein
MQTELFSEVNKVDLAVPPLSRAAGTASSSWFPMRDYGRVAGILQFSDIPAGNTVQLVLALLVRRTPRFYPVPLTGVTQVVA